MRWKQQALALCFVLSSSSALADPVTCGAPGKPACPMQHWMRQHAALALAKKDGAALATHFEAIGRMNPSKKEWGNWDSFAKEGAEAARAGRMSGVITTCGRCHSVYRATYNAKYRLRSVVGD